MSTMKIGAPNLVELNYVALSGGAWGTTLGNLRSVDFGLLTISTAIGGNNNEFMLDFSALAAIQGYTPGIDCLMIPRSNLTQAATIDIKAGTAAFTTGGAGGGSVTTIATGAAALTQNVYAAGFNTLFGKNSTTTPDKVIDTYARPVLKTFTRQASLFWWVRLNDGSNPDGFLSLARLMMAPLYTPSFNLDYGVTVEPYGQRVSDTSIANSDFIDPTAALRRLVSFQITDTPMDEGVAYFQRLGLYLGYAKQAIFIFDPADTVHMDLRAFAVTQLKPVGLTYRNFGTTDINAQFLEIF